jgi:hypothetical protein
MMFKKRIGRTKRQLGLQRSQKQMTMWYFSLLLCLVASTIRLHFKAFHGGSFQISQNFLSDSPIMPKFKFDHSRYQYHPPKSRVRSAELVDIGPGPECGNGPSFDQYFKNLSVNPDHRSANNEDKTIYETLFRHMNDQEPQKQRTYIELGAFDGLTESNTRFLTNA